MSFEREAYVAGLIDGEGCMGIYAKKYTNSSIPWRPHLSVTLTNLETLNYLSREYGGRVWKHASRPNRKPCWRWMLTGKTALYFVATTYPWLIVKRREAEVMLDVLFNYPPRLPGRGKHYSDSWSQKLAEASVELKRLKKVA